MQWKPIVLALMLAAAVTVAALCLSLLVFPVAGHRAIRDQRSPSA